MIKLKTIPTPAQARILKALKDNNGLVIIWNQRTRGEWTGTRWPDIKRELGNPRQSTLRKLAFEEWIEPDGEGSIFWELSEEGKLALKRATIFEDKSKAQVTVDDMLKAIKRLHQPSTMIITELPIQYPALGVWGTRYLDAFAIARNGKTTVYELKVSREDWLKELSDPEKRRPGMDVANHFQFAAPRGIIQPDEVPSDCGLLEFEQGALMTVVRPGLLHRELPDGMLWHFIADVARLASRGS